MGFFSIKTVAFANRSVISPIQVGPPAVCKQFLLPFKSSENTNEFTRLKQFGLKMAPARSTGAVVAAISVSVAVISLFLCNFKSKSSSKRTKPPLSSSKKKPRSGLVDAIGNTPLIRINSLSDATGCEVSWAVLSHSFVGLL